MLRTLFYLFIVKPLVTLILGIHVRNQAYLPRSGPAIIVANHNSHLDTMVLLSLFPLRLIKKIRPIAAADYFLSNRFVAWFAFNIAGIIPIERRAKSSQQTLNVVIEALQRGEIVIIFPEGTRGEPEIMGKLKNGIGHLVSECPDVPVIPVFLYGLGKCLPKGEVLLVPFFVDVFVGEPLLWQGSRSDFMTALTQRMTALQQQAIVQMANFE